MLPRAIRRPPGRRRIAVGSDTGIFDSFLIRKMKDYRKMSRAELLTQVQQLKSRHAARSRAQRQQAVSAVRDREERLRAILETAVEGIITIDQRGIIESFNPASERIFGYKAREVIGKNVSLLMPSPHRRQHDTYLANYLHTGSAKIIGIGREVSGRRKDGTIFPMDLSVSEVKLADRRLFTGFVRDITERKQLEKRTLEISEREQRRIGHDLHDGLCQHLAGIELLSEVLEQKMARRSKTAAAQAGEITRNVRDAISQTRSLARGLSPVTLEADGLMTALHELAGNTETLFRVTCRFHCDPPVFIQDPAVASHLFRIAQEAVSNAIKHGKAKRISLGLEAVRGKITLRVDDNGMGLPAPLSIRRQKGMGLRIMQSRAGMIGGTLALQRGTPDGVTVLCSVPNRAAKATRNHAP
jgi:two-component system CheB/CheR fusion protein